jgi:hypothetical protein
VHVCTGLKAWLFVCRIETICIFSIDINATKASAVVLKDLAQAKSYFSLIESICILSIDINATKASVIVLKDLAQAKSYFIHQMEVKKWK